MDTDFITAREAAHILQCSPDTVHKMRDRLVPVRMGGPRRPTYYRSGDVFALKRSGWTRAKAGRPFRGVMP